MFKQGWGYNDHSFSLTEDGKEVFLKGSKYELCGKRMPHFKAWVEGFLHLDFTKTNFP